MCLNDVKRFSHNEKLSFFKVYWSAVINFTRTNTVSTSSTGTNISSIGKGVLQWSCGTGEFSQGGTPFVDGKLENF